MSALDSWLQALPHDPQWRPPATEGELQAAEQALEAVFPAEVQALYRHGNGTRAGLIAGLPLLSLVQAQTVNARMQDAVDDNPGDPNFNPAIYTSTPPDAIAPYYWQSQWLALAQEGDNYVCVDLAPGDKGKVGQIIQCGREEAHTVLAPDLETFFQQSLALTDLKREDFGTTFALLRQAFGLPG